MNKTLILVIVVLAVVVFPVIWYLASPLFIDKTVSEEFPIVESNQENLEMENVPAIYSGNFVDADSFHMVSGTANVLSDGNSEYLRFENFRSTNGPDLKVYLAEYLEAASYISLGELKGNIGDQNYEIPAGTDLEKYNYALIWCEQFSVLFGYAELSSS